MKRATICLLCREGKLLIGVKKEGFGAGKKNMPGGKIKDGETIKLAGKREISEEANIQIEENRLELVGRVGFYFDGEYVFEGYILIARDFEGEASDSEEMGDFNLCPFEGLPYDEMWIADRLWIPLILHDGKKIEATVHFNADGTEVKSFSYKEAKFD